ncbi:leucine-rich repeat domain-containing protein [Candidatus Leptofilum sp.]|uniref:leucine-rich repeat domain-containing protein n=1 Tax=Candidatus Leptofilum sp. TaxID=3241576 RepID=UPI003B5932DC
MNKKDLQQIISQALAEKWDKLDLSNQDILDLPSEICQLKNLISLDLSFNQLAALPSSLFQLENLVELNLSFNALEKIPAEISQLRNLIYLDISVNDVTVVPSEIGKLSRLNSLDLGNNNITEIPSEIGQLSNLTSIDLRGNSLMSIPAELGHLTQLTSLELDWQNLKQIPEEFEQLAVPISLNLSGKRLEILPVGISHLTNLTSLDASNNQLTTIPAEIGQLTKLTKLNLSGNSITSVPSEIGRPAKLTLLDLSNNKLTTLPSEIGQLTELTKLNLSGNSITSFLTEIGRLAKLTLLDLGNNQLTTLLSEIGQLTKLTKLNLNGNSITSVPSEIGKLTNLTLLDLSRNPFIDVPKEIGELINLTAIELDWQNLKEIPKEFEQLAVPISLNLSGKRLETLPVGISHLTNLTSLDASNNQLTTIPAEIGQLTKLTKLNLNGNSITSVPSEIGKLTNLTLLDLSRNPFIDVPKEIGELINLTAIELDWQNLKEIPEEFKQLAVPTWLNLRDRELTELPEGIGYLVSLNTLDLSYNLLTEVPSEIGQLKNLRFLYLAHNQLTRLPDELINLKKLETLYLFDNPELGISKEILQGSPSFILRTYFSQRRPLHEAKMLIVGQGGVGKTALVRRLIHNEPPNKEQGKTEGIDIQKWKFMPNGVSTPITLNLWDFGGQGVYQATHQFFFTTRSLYLVVINARTGEQESRLRHWLKLVGSLSDYAPVIIVVNKQDEHSLQLDERALKYKYPNLLNIIPTSCITGMGITKLREAIGAALIQLPNIFDPFPADWLTLKEQLEKMDANYITYERYVEYCMEAGVRNRVDQRNWVRVLHRLGIILNYQDDNYRQLEGTHVLKPEWVTDAVYQILSDPYRRIANNAGILKMTMLDEILDPSIYPPHQQVFILGMMQKFELCFRIPSKQSEYLVPDLLPKEQPKVAEQFQKNHLLQLEIHYTEFLPDSILSRFMVGMMAVLDSRSSWLNGAVLKFDDNEALIRSDPEARKLFIVVSGTETTRRSLLNSIRMQLHAIHSSFPNLPLNEHIPIPGHPDKTIAYHALCNLEAKGIEQHYDPFNDVELDVKQLLAGIETPALRRERQIVVLLREKYDLDELRDLCHKLDIEYENLPGQTKSAKTRELVQLLGRRGRLNELDEQLKLR